LICLREALSSTVDKNVQVPAVLVLEQEKLIGLIPREKVYEKLGRPFGVELFLKMNIKQFYGMLGLQTLSLVQKANFNRLKLGSKSA